MTRRSFGQIKRLSEDRWQVRWPAGYHANGKRREKSEVVRGTRADAERRLARAMLDAGVETTFFDMVTLEEYWDVDYSREIQRLAPKTVDDYTRTWESTLKPLMGRLAMSRITARQARQLLLTIEAPGQQRNAFKLLRQMLNLAAADGIIDYNPLPRQMRLDKIHHRETQVYTAAELPAFLEAINGEDVEAMALCQIFGGLRREEATGLRWSDFRFENVPTLHGGRKTAYIAIQRTAQLIGGEVVLGEGKTDKSRRTVIISGYPAERLAEIAGSGWLNPSKKVDGECGNPQTYAQRLKTIQRENGLREVPPTGLRATYSTLHAQLGTPDALVSMMMGHSQLNTRYRHYLGANVDAAEAAAAALGRMVNGHDAATLGDVEQVG